MSEPEQRLEMQPYQKHIFMCVGNSCHDAQKSSELYQYLKDRLKELGLDKGAQRIARSKSTCLGICQGGPVSVVYPEGIWYRDLTREKIDQIIDQHLRQNQPIREWVFYPKV